MGRVRDALSRHPAMTAVAVVVATLGVVATWVWWTQLRVPYVEVSFVVPAAPQLAATGEDQRVYRIDASRSLVRYEVEERLAGASSTAVGTTSGIAGDIVIDRADPAASRVGEVVVNVQQFTSDQQLRDQRLQHDFLESKDHPLATFVTNEVRGLPSSIDDGVDYDLELVGELTVKETTAPVTVAGTARLDGDELIIDAETEVLMSTFGVGPITLIGFVSTSDEVRLGFELVAVDAALHTPPDLIAAPSRPEPRGDGPSFVEVVAPILEQNCASCHQPGEAGAEYWELQTAADAAEVASGLGLVTSARYMPPWPATDVGIALLHERRLDDDQIAALVAWGEAGGPLDVEPGHPVRAPDRDIEPVRPDVVLPLPEPYQGSTAVTNDYRCFVLDPGFTETTWIASYEFRPDRREIVHHATAFRVEPDELERLAGRDGEDGRPGWECFSGNPASDQFMAWAPGQDPTRFPDGSAMRFEPGQAVVVQMHYHYAHQAPADRSEVVFELAEGEPDEIEFGVYLAPAEIPCREGDTAPTCDREVVIAELERDYGPAGRAIPDALLRACGAKVEDFTHMTDGTASAECEHRVRHVGQLVAVFGHMHERGKTFRMTLNRGTPDEQVLLDIDEWDFAWQLNYVPAEHIELREGDRLHIECSWDRARKFDLIPRYITWNEGTEDEMCYSTITVRRLGD